MLAIIGRHKYLTLCAIVILPFVLLFAWVDNVYRSPEETDRLGRKYFYENMQELGIPVTDYVELDLLLPQDNTNAVWSYCWVPRKDAVAGVTARMHVMGKLCVSVDRRIARYGFYREVGPPWRYERIFTKTADRWGG